MSERIGETLYRECAVLEHEVEQLLRAFQDRTGLCVSTVEIELSETTHVSSARRTFRPVVTIPLTIGDMK